MSKVQKFYAEKHVFITGGTGFLGIILTEKLLRSCSDIKTIYLLIREKKGKSVQERIDALLVDPVFDVLRNECPDFSKKIVAVAGDITQEGLGLSAADHALIVNEVSVIFHLAATVRFNEKLENAVTINVNSTKSIVDLAKACTNLEVGVYVSTAYSHCVRKSIDEQLYPPPLSYAEVNKLIEDMRKRNLSEDEEENFTKATLKKWPNTYSFTKAIAEGVIAEYAQGIPFAVYRPSIVLTTYREPIPGWLSSPIGLPGMVAATYLGLVHFNNADRRIVIDPVPVDYVCNALIACAWDSALTQRRHPGDMPVYNYISGNQNPLTWGEFTDSALTFGNIYPSNSMIYHVTIASTTSRLLYIVPHYLFHLIPALMFDAIGRLFGKPPRLYNLQRKIGKVSSALAYFGIQQWDFKNSRVQNLWKRFGSTDRQIFPFGIQNVDWEEHSMHMVRGIRRHIVGEKEDNLATARRRQLYFYILHKMVQLVTFIFFVWVIWSIYNWLNFNSTL